MQGQKEPRKDPAAASNAMLGTCYHHLCWFCTPQAQHPTALEVQPTVIQMVSLFGALMSQCCFLHLLLCSWNVFMRQHDTMRSACLACSRCIAFMHTTQRSSADCPISQTATRRTMARQLPVFALQFLQANQKRRYQASSRACFEQKSNIRLARFLQQSFCKK